MSTQTQDQILIKHWQEASLTFNVKENQCRDCRYFSELSEEKRNWRTQGTCSRYRVGAHGKSNPLYVHENTTCEEFDRK